MDIFELFSVAIVIDFTDVMAMTSKATFSSILSTCRT